MSIEKQLATSWDTLYTTAAHAIDWVKDVRPNVMRLNNEADSIILELHRLRNTAKRLSDVSEKQITAGFFGLSQAGKSYLISALAADSNGQLETRLNNKTLNFIDHINPPGGGSEATGLVTRFTFQTPENKTDFPLELRVFSEIDLVKIFINAYVEDLSKHSYTLSSERVNTLLKESKQKVNATVTQGINTDDIVDLNDYIQQNFAAKFSGLQGTYWKQAMEWVPKLSIEDRAKFFSILWGEIGDITRAYIQLATTLTQLGNPERVFAPLSAVVSESATGIKHTPNSIINVNMLYRLGSPEDTLIDVKTQINGVEQKVAIPLAQLTALVSEINFPLVNEPRVPIVKKVDLLDFPGYRGRGKKETLSEVHATNPIAELILRGKVAYLFERYTENQEMNILVICTPANAQSEVAEVGPILEKWVNKTQGDTPQKRAQHKPGLLWAITKFDTRIVADLDKKEDILENSWGHNGGLLKQTLLEKFGTYSWVENWANDTPFNNIFLVRKPGFDVPFLNVENGHELGINESKRSQLNLLKSTFCNDPDVQKYIRTPSEAWDAMLVPNDGGITRISDYITQIADPKIKSDRLKEQLNDLVFHFVGQRFEPWYQPDGDDAMAKKKAIANGIAKELYSRSPHRFMMGELLHSLELPEETIRTLYYSDLEDLEENSDTTDSTQVVEDDDFDLFGDNTPATTDEEQAPTLIKQTKESLFAVAVYKAWITHLRALSSNTKLRNYLGLQEKNINNLAEELIAGADRLKLKTKLSDLALQNDLISHKREQVAERQVFSMAMTIADFIAWLGFTQESKTLPNSRVHVGKKVFVPNEIEFEHFMVKANKKDDISKQISLPILSETPYDNGDLYRMDWLSAFGQFALDNIGYTAGREITLQQNAQLGKVITDFSSAKLSD